MAKIGGATHWARMESGTWYALKGKHILARSNVDGTWRRRWTVKPGNDPLEQFKKVAERFGGRVTASKPKRYD